MPGGTVPIEPRAECFFENFMCLCLEFSGQIVMYSHFFVIDGLSGRIHVYDDERVWMLEVVRILFSTLR